MFLAIFLITVGSATSAAVGFGYRKRRARTEAVAEAGRRLVPGRANAYQAAPFTDTTGVEVAVWLLLEEGAVVVSRDGRVHATVATRLRQPEADSDPVRAEVLRKLSGTPQGLKVHELADGPRMSQALGDVEDMDLPGLWFVYVDSRPARAARTRLRVPAQAVLDARFADLGFAEERAAAALYRHRAPLYVPPGTRKPRRRDDTSPAYLADSSPCGSSCASDSGCGGGGCGGCGG